MEPLLGTLAELQLSPGWLAWGWGTNNTGLPLGFLSTPWGVALISLQTPPPQQSVNCLSSQQGYCCFHSVKAQR